MTQKGIILSNEVEVLESTHRNCNCFVCRNHFDFSLPQGLISDFMSGSVAIFAGAGISTENRSVLRETFFESICYELDINPNDFSFPEAMSMYESQHNGRINLINKLKYRFDHIDSFPEIKGNASRFHKELATFYPVEIIITTNWDNYFEDKCGATAFVDAGDIAFWDDVKGRKVLKIHGSIDRMASIIATESDYKKNKKNLRKGVLGSVLKMILATKTIVFVGYSVKDDDFNSIFSLVKRELKEFKRDAYIVTPDEEEQEYKKLGLVKIKTDGTYFISRIKEHAEIDLKGHFVPDSVYDIVELLLKYARIEHSLLFEKIKVKDNPEVIMCACYQDGLQHGLEKILSLRKNGTLSHKCMVQSVVSEYMNVRRKEKLKKRMYEDVSYIDGYVNAMLVILYWEEGDDEVFFDSFPFCYVYGFKYDIPSITDYMEIEGIPDIHKGAYKRSKYLAGKTKLEKSEDDIYHHYAWL